MHFTETYIEYVAVRVIDAGEYVDICMSVCIL